MAKCFDVVGYVEPCNAVRQKYTGRALLIVANGFSLTMANNGIILEEISGFPSFSEFYESVKASLTTKCLPVIVDVQNPFGVTVQGNTDSGRVMYTKTIPVSIPATRDGKSEEFVMGLQSGISGASALLVLEKSVSYTDNTDVFGVHSPVHLDPTSVTRSEYENGGAWTFNLVCEEPVPNVICEMSNLSAVLDILNV